MSIYVPQKDTQAEANALQELYESLCQLPVAESPEEGYITFQSIVYVARCVL